MGGRKILVVDDSKVAAMFLQMILERCGYEISVASDGGEAVKKAAEELPDLILMDVVMPGLNGFEATRLLRSRHATRDIPIIMVTTRGEELNVEAGQRAGCNEYVTKPVDGAELAEKVRLLLGG